MDNERDTRLDRALSKGHFSVQEKEQMLGSLLGALETEPAVAHQTATKARRWFANPLFWIGIPSLGAAAAALIFWFAPAPHEAELVARGGSEELIAAAPITVSLRCGAHAEPVTCAAGSTLQLAVSPQAHGAWAAVAAFGPDRVLTWYFPDEQGRSLPLQLSRLGVAELPLDVALPLGQYRLLVIVSPEPLTRAVARGEFEQMLDGDALDLGGATLVDFTVTSAERQLAPASDDEGTP